MKKSELQLFLELYRSVGIEPEIEHLENGYLLRLEVGDSEKITGYNMFYTALGFNLAGEFIEQIIAE